jgi:DNA-directed RNA polymerase II subunit RPB2
LVLAVVLTVRTERRETDDRDHFGNKRLDMAGALMAGLFRQLFRRLIDDVKRTLTRDYLDGKAPRLVTAVKARTVTRGMQYALATGAC